MTLTNREFKKVAFPSHPEKNGPLLEVVRKEVAPVTRTLALDRFVALLEVAEADKAVRALQLDHTPPRIVFSTTPAILAYVDGEPAWRPVKDTKLERAINTRVLLVRQGDDRFYLHVFDGWMTTKALDGTWEPEKKAVEGPEDGRGGREGLGAGRSPPRRQPERREDPALAEAGPQPAHPDRHEADGADRHRGRAELRPHRGDRAPLRQEHDRQRVPPHPRPEGLRARLRPVVPLRDAGGPLGVRGERRAPARLREDPGRERQGERQGRGGGHARRRRKRSSPTSSRRRPR